MTDGCLLYARNWIALRELNLKGTRVADSGLVHLRHLPNLESLNLAETHVTDDGLVHLRGLAKLRQLNVERTAVTEAGLRAFQHLQPNVVIRWAERHDGFRAWYDDLAQKWSRW